MSVEHCSSLSPSLRAKLQNAGLLWIDDVCRLLVVGHSQTPTRNDVSQQNDTAAASPHLLLERCPQLTWAEAMNVVKAILPLYKGNVPAETDYYVPLGILTLEEMLKLEADKEDERVTTFCRGMDLLLGGGMAVGDVSEICGPPGVGKTQLLMQLTVNCMLPKELGGLNGACLFIDTEGSFVPERFREIVQAAVMQVKDIILRQEAGGFVGNNVTVSDEGGLAVSTSNGSGSTTTTTTGAAGGFGSGLSTFRKRSRSEGRANDLGAAAAFFTVDHVLQRTQYLRVMDVVSLMALLNAFPMYLASHPEIRMVVIDSIAFPFRSFSHSDALEKDNVDSGATTTGVVASKHLTWQRSRLLFSCGQLLQRHAREHNLCIIVSNQVTSRTLSTDSLEGSRVLVPALGDSWAYGLSTRLLLTQQHDQIMEKGRGAEHEGCHENVAFVTSAVQGGFDVGSPVNAVQHRVARLVKHPTRPRGQCCFSLSQKGVRDVYKVWS